MNIADWLSQATEELDVASIPTARLDALVLLEDQLGIDRAQLLAHPEQTISLRDKNVLKQHLARRLEHVPLAYVRGKTEFYGRTFTISPAVLEPRPESETMIDMLKNLVMQLSKNVPFDKPKGAVPVTPCLPAMPLGKQHILHVADVGSGSGALGITAQLELPNVAVDLLEIDNEALLVSKSNVVLHTLSVSVIKSDLLRNSLQNYDILLCNLPYIPDEFHINTAASHEPHIAIFGGPDGLSLYRRLFVEMQNLQQQPLYVLTESLPTQHAQLKAIADKGGYSLVQSDDFIQLFSKPK